MNAPQIIVETKGVGKDFKTRKRDTSGLASAVKSFIKPEYKTVTAVDSVDLSLHAGEIRALIGPNGAGKSTLIKMLCGVLFPSRGIIRCFGMEPWKDRVAYVRKIGAVFGQKSQLMWDLPPIDTFTINKKIYRIPDAQYARSLDYFDSLFGLSGFRNRSVRSLSLGERMRCELVAALLHEPELVFLDEPTIGMDILAKDMVRSFVREVNRDRGVTFILTTHDLGDVENLCNRVSVINQGQLVFDRSMDALQGTIGSGKILELTFSRPLDENEIKRAREDGAELCVKDGKVLSATWKLAGEEADALRSARIFSSWPVADMSIRDPDIESIIRTLYQGEPHRSTTE